MNTDPEYLEKLGAYGFLGLRPAGGPGMTVMSVTFKLSH